MFALLVKHRFFFIIATIFIPQSGTGKYSKNVFMKDNFYEYIYKYMGVWKGSWITGTYNIGMWEKWKVKENINRRTI